MLLFVELLRIMPRGMWFSRKDQNYEKGDGSDPEFLGEIIVSKGGNKNSEASDLDVDRLPGSMSVSTSDAWTDLTKDTILAHGSVGILR